MIFWSEKKLAVKLRDDMVSAKEQLVYLALGNLIIAYFISCLYGKEVFRSDIYGHIYHAILVITAVILPIVIFKINNKGDGKDFLMRYICLNLPITIKLFLLQLLTASFTYYLDNPDLYRTVSRAAINHSFANTIDTTKNLMKIGPYTIAANIFINLVLFWKYAVAFKIASGQTAREVPNV